MTTALLSPPEKPQPDAPALTGGQGCFAGVLTPPDDQQQKENDMTTETIERNKETVRRFLAGTHSQNIDDVEVIDETVVPHIVCHGFPGFPGGEFRDRESYKAFFRIFRQSFSDMTFETTRMIATEDFVSAHWEIWATHSGEFQGVAPDNARVVFDGVALYRLEDGQIAETWLTINEPLLVSQLGKAARAA